MMLERMRVALEVASSAMAEHIQNQLFWEFLLLWLL